MLKFLKQYARLLGYLKRYQVHMAFLLLCSGLYAMASQGRVMLVLPVIDQVLANKNLFVLKLVGVGVLFCAVTMGVSEFLQEFLRRTIMWRVMVDLRNDLCESLIRSSMEFFNRERCGALMSRVSNDVATAQKAIFLVLSDVILSPMMLIGGVAVCLWVSPGLSLAAFVFVPVLVIPLYILGRKVKKASRKSLAKLADTTEAMHQIFTGIRAVKTFRMEDHKNEEFRDLNRQFLRRTLRMVRARALSSSFTSLMSNVAMGLMILAGGYLIIRGRIDLTAGQLITFGGALASMYKPMKDLTRAYNDIQESLAGSERVFELIDMRPAVRNAPRAKDMGRFSYSITFNNVSFAYGSEKVLIDVNLTVQKGETVAIVGPSGAGKSTMLDLVPRFYDPTAGSVEIDGHDLRNVTLESLRDQIAIVSQDPFLFHDTIAANIRHGRRNASDGEVMAAAKAAHADAFMDVLPNGYDTVVGERGVMLSGGQRQRITIARAVLKNAPILILDEATSSLDSESERAVQDALENLMQNRTTLVVAHRLSTVQRVDRIVVLNYGRIVDAGTHGELFKRCELYRRMCELQFADEEAHARRE